MLGNETLWDVARQCDAVLRAAAIPYAVAGGVAVCLHGYRRNTVDLDLLVRAADADAIRTALESSGFEWSAAEHEYRSPSGVAVQFLTAGERAGTGTDVELPDPSDSRATVEREGLCVLSLAKLIDAKIACGEGNVRRSHKDFADVVELIAVNQLDGSFARHLHKSVRKTFRQLVRNAQAQ